MCEFCAEHGEGKQWYLSMKNYSRELLADPRPDALALHGLQCLRGGVRTAGDYCKLGL